MIAKIISGGQTGVDRAALDVALELGIPCGGYCPKGRRAEDGRIPDRYPLEELDTERYSGRTAYNVSEADAVLILHAGRIGASPGTALTMRICRRQRKLWTDVDLNSQDEIGEYGVKSLGRWLEHHQVGTLNIAGPRESKCPGIYDRAAAFLRQVLSEE